MQPAPSGSRTPLDDDRLLHPDVAWCGGPGGDRRVPGALIASIGCTLMMTGGMSHGGGRDARR
jgi:hypothetical protein